MPRIHTHYDNLKVSRSAPPEVVRAAYKTLSQKFHPDRNPGDPDSQRIMTIINRSYDVLADPAKREAHDRWISEQEREQVVDEGSGPSNSARSQTAPRPVPPIGARVMSHLGEYWVGYAIVGAVAWYWGFYEPAPPPPGPKPYSATAPAEPSKPAYVRPSAAPNGQPWPAGSAYVKGFPVLNATGLSSVTVDNSKNDSDVFVKLISLDGATAHPVRTFFIPAGGTFRANKMKAGNYDVRYRDLNTGRLSRSEAFSLEETATSDGRRFSNLTMTLYKVRDGNMKTFGLPEGEF